MIVVSGAGEQREFADLELAMAHARTLDHVVVIAGEGYEVVGKFGVDSIQDGRCPDGVAYDWNKSSRIGSTRRHR